MCQRDGIDQTLTLLFESKNHLSINPNKLASKFDRMEKVFISSCKYILIVVIRSYYLLNISSNHYVGMISISISRRRRYFSRRGISMTFVFMHQFQALTFPRVKSISHTGSMAPMLLSEINIMALASSYISDFMCYVSTVAWYGLYIYIYIYEIRTRMGIYARPCYEDVVSQCGVS